MPTDTRDPDPFASSRRADSLWQFALKTYGRPGVAEACLDLQDGHGANVNVLLYAAWTAAGLGNAPTEAEWCRILAALAGWQKAATLPLREIRRRLKPLAEEAQIAHVRAAVKEAELRAERREIGLLADQAATGGKVSGASGAARLVQDYARAAGLARANGFDEAVRRFIACAGLD